MKNPVLVRSRPVRGAALAVGIASCIAGGIGRSQAAVPTLVDPALGVRTAMGGLTTPIGIAFLGPNDWLVVEKDTGQVKRVTNGAVAATVLDLAVNNSSERGLLGIALHPQFASNHFVYLYWTCSAAAPPTSSPYFPTATTCPDTPALGADTSDLLAVPLLGNRIDRFVLNGSTLVYDRNLIKLRVFQNDAAPTPPDQGDADQPVAGNHNAGVLRFGPDGKVYLQFGDVGRRGQLQNLPSGPTLTGLGPTVPDDQFGGPEPDNAHFTGVILRLNADGSTPTDNPFFAAGASIGGEVGANVQRIFAYGIRNGFGMAFDPLSGRLWDEENGEDAFDELNLVTRGSNSGWIQFTGPSGRITQYKQIETTSLHDETFPNLQQYRWGPERIANTPAEGFARLFRLSGSSYSEPEFSWKNIMAPAGIGFLGSRALGSQYQGDLFVGFAEAEPLEGPLFHFNLTGNRQKIAVEDTRLADRVMDNTEPHDLTEGETLLFGAGFGIVTDIQTGPNGNLFVVSLDHGNIYEIFRR
jgi:glucose/arabinose dehydrogenase